MGTPYRTSSREYLLFEAALEIRAPWFIKEVRLDNARHRLDINPGFQHGAHFACNTCKKEYTAYDTRIRVFGFLKAPHYMRRSLREYVVHATPASVHADSDSRTTPHYAFLPLLTRVLASLVTVDDFGLLSLTPFPAPPIQNRSIEKANATGKN
jgi:hypothetical protein